MNLNYSFGSFDSFGQQGVDFPASSGSTLKLLKFGKALTKSYFLV